MPPDRQRGAWRISEGPRPAGGATPRALGVPPASLPLVSIGFCAGVVLLPGQKSGVADQIRGSSHSWSTGRTAAVGCRVRFVVIRFPPEAAGKEAAVSGCKKCRVAFREWRVRGV